MEPINNVGAANYAMTVPQSENQVQGMEDYSSMPMVYDPAMEEKSQAASNKTGLMALGAIALAGIGLGTGYLIWGKKKAGSAEVKELAEDAKKAFEEQIQNLTKERDGLKKCNEEAGKIADEKTFLNPGLRTRCERIKKALNPDAEDAKKVEKKAEEAASEVKDKVDDAAKAAEDNAAKE